MYLSTFKYHLNHKISRLGFTLVEMIVVIALSTTLMMVITVSVTTL
ncbi:prepilin-type N-terminal cleavage/methylation domain-containing protein, partial [Candidatus Kaiserbacteria bacterium]|nr:prepilin-type N-terminal cleavage/methylation domain-containing protein [Candidatus Kaiserbacteria bacterium]